MILFCHEDSKAIEAILSVELGKFSNWLSSNKMPCNVSKSNVVAFNTFCKKKQVIITLKINNEVISEVLH